MNASVGILSRLFTLALAIGAASCDVPDRGLPAFERAAEDFEALGPWSTGASEGSLANASAADGVDGAALRLDYQFPKGSGYAFLRRPVDLDLAANFELSFHVRGAAPASTFEIKFTDESGDNVWWRQFRAKEFSAEWETIRIRRSDIAFAWGPTSDRALKKIAGIEFVIVGAAGEKGVIDFDGFAIRPLPEPPATPPAIVASASGEQRGAPAEAAVDGDPKTVWRAPPARKQPSTLVLDLGYPRDIGGLTLDWAAGEAPAQVEAEFSEDRKSWSPMRVLKGNEGGATLARAREAFGRYVRLHVSPAKGRSAALAEARIEDKAFGADDTAFIQAIADRASRGAFPRSFSHEQSYWTIVGSPAGGQTALMSEDGAIEPGPGSFSIEPFIIADGSVRGWADGEHAQWLEGNYLPLPHVRRIADDFTLDVSAHAAPAGQDDGGLVARYRIANKDARPRKFTLALAVRPFQVNPPTQFLNIAGGASPISRLEWSGKALAVNDDWRLHPSRQPSRIALASAISGSVAIAGAEPGAPRIVEAPDGFGSAVAYFDVTLAPGASEEFALVARQKDAAPDPSGMSDAAMARSAKAAAEEWRAALGETVIEGPFEASELLDSIRTAHAHIMMTRDGAALRPGARSYARAWIRDGAMIAESLLRLGQAGPAIDFARWYAPYQFESGKIPCCVDARGADPVPENDSHGEFIFLVAEIYRFTGDATFAMEMWPHVDRAAAAINALRLSEKTGAGTDKEMPVHDGLLPPSISHEGYSDKPAYSYWDNFWGLKGLKDAAFLAGALGFNPRADELNADADAFSADITASIARIAETAGVNFIPGAADRLDFDATSTTVALAPTGSASALPAQALAETFERAWREFVLRRDGEKDWNDYTPYEFRQVGSFLRLGRPDRAHALMDFYMRDRRPAGWNQWAEVVGREAREPRFIGDMPHTWVASDFIRAALDFFVYENHESASLVVGAGVKRSWMADGGVRVRNLETPHGSVSYSATERNGVITIDLAGDATPPGGFLFPTALIGSDFDVTVNDKPAAPIDGAVLVKASPARIVLKEKGLAKPAAASARTLEIIPGQREVAVTDASGRSHRLLLYFPPGAAESAATGKLPLLLFMHGSGERGDDISKVKVHGPPKLVESAGLPFIVASPLLAADARWDAEAMAGLVEFLLEATPADKERVYATGLSLGGHGTWALAAARPDLFAAIAPISGAGAPASAPALVDMPVWSFHGARDDIVAAGRNISMVEAVNEAGGAARLTLYPDLGHDAWTRTYENPELYEWLLSHRRRPAANE